ncbi:acid phosphatase-domain-containing protein [Diplogelasinospora grovesii]|uniref:Acid phosphatase-domain-containing protein n=1 Tax=Diplogelasinospora grovesii TaxID=303347 RepID=A0AAN6N4U1_9PEZI|nr:acid phosphatase-domain-containing protein [Diplogelasinospora grovesii]
MAPPYPKLVAFDLDGTAWSGWLKEERFGRKGWVNENQKEDNIGVVEIRSSGDMILIDRMNADDTRSQCWVARDLPIIIRDLRKRGTLIAIASRNTHKAMAIRALWMIKVKDPKDGRVKPLTDLIDYLEVQDVPKTTHFERFKNWSGRRFHQMMLIDDKAENRIVEWWQGATFVKVKDSNSGVTWTDYNEGLDKWRRYRQIQFRMPGRIRGASRTKLIGYASADAATAQRYKRGERRLATGRPARWGYALYVADDPRVSEWFATWRRENDPANHWVCAIYTRDWDAFRAMDKVWIPNNKTRQVDNMHQTDAQTAESQERLDNWIKDAYWVQEPFIAFCRHQRMTRQDNDMYWLGARERFSEMVIYPNLQDALFYGEPLPLAEAVARRENTRSWPVLDWHMRGEEWNIQANGETVRDFEKHGEIFSFIRRDLYPSATPLAIL